MQRASDALQSLQWQSASRLYVHRHRILGHIPLLVSFSQSNVSVNEPENAGGIGECLQRKRLPAGMGQSRSSGLYGRQQLGFCSSRCLHQRFTGYDIEVLWEALKHGTNAHLQGTASGRLGYESYNKLGYVANNIGIGQNVARTLEYAYNDWAIYTLGKKLGKPAGEIDIYKKRALNYKNVYHPERKLMVGKDDKGVFNRNFDAVDWSGEFCEGTAGIGVSVYSMTHKDLLT